MDKSWIKAKITSKTFKDGVLSFIDFAKLTDVRGLISCPCLRCCNTKWLNVDTVHAHILHHGFLPGYTTWTFHGEHDTPSPLPKSSDDTQTFTIQDDIRGLIRDALGVSSLHSNIEEPESQLEGDVDPLRVNSLNLNNEELSESGIEGDTHEATGINPNFPQSNHDADDIRYKKLLEECDKELWIMNKENLMKMRQKHEQGNILRTKKMSIKGVCKLNAGEHVLVHVNEFDQPIRAAGGLCTRYMTLLLKQPNLCPPDVTTWKELKIRSGVRLMAELRKKFSLPHSDNVDRVIFCIFDDKYRSLKHQLKSRLLDLVAEKLKEADSDGDDGVEERQYNEEELLQGLDLLEAPSNFKNDQWEYYKNHLRTDKAKKLSHNGKKARAQQVHHRVTGSTSHARKKDEFKLKNKRQPNEVESFNLLYQTKNGSYVDDTSRELMDRAREEISKRVLMLENSSEFVGPEALREIESDVMRDLMGSDNPGRAPCYGAGVRKSQLTNLSHGLKRLKGDNLRNDMLLGKLESQYKQIESQNMQIASQSKKIEAQNKQIEGQNKQILVQNKQIRTMQETINVIRSDLQLFQTAFRGMYGPTPAATTPTDTFFPTSGDAYFPRSSGFAEQISGRDMD